MVKEKIAVLIPCYNESQSIGKVVGSYKKAIPGADIYVYDNNSTDNTTEIARKAGAIVRYEAKQGKGNVVRSMFRDIDADAYIMVDGDDTYPVEDARNIANLVLGGVDMVIGDRLSATYFTENKRRGHNFGNKLVRKLVNAIFKANVRDIMTGYRGFSYGFVKSFPALSSGFEIETEMTIHALDKSMRLQEVPVQYRDRSEGSESKLNTVRDGIRVLITIFNMIREFKPLFFFGIFGLLSFGLALLFGIPPIVEFAETHLVKKIPSLIAGGILLVIALLLWITGLICDLTNKKHRQLFEVNLNILNEAHSRK